MKTAKFTCDGCKENLQEIFDIDHSHIEMKIIPDGNNAQEISDLQGDYDFCNLTCLQKWLKKKKIRNYLKREG